MRGTLALIGAATGHVSFATAQPISLTPGAMQRIGAVDERYQSYNVEMLEVTAGSGGLTARSSRRLSVFGGDLGVAYLGTQGDPWDAQKDMALATLGAIIAMLITAAVNWRFQRDFARVWAESLRVKHPAPLGEDALVRELREHR